MAPWTRSGRPCYGSGPVALPIPGLLRPAIMLTVRPGRTGGGYVALAEVVEPICSAEAETAAAAVELVTRGLNDRFPDGWRAAGRHAPETVPVLTEQLGRILARRRPPDRQE